MYAIPSKGPRLRVPREGFAQRRRHRDLSFGQIQRDLDLDRVPRLDTGAVAHGSTEAEDTLAAHPCHRRAPLVAVDRRENGKALGPLADRGHLIIVEDDGGGRAARHER